MGTTAEAAKISQSLAYASIGFGVVGAAAPRLFLKLYRLRGDDTARVFTRMWGLANLVIGVDALRIDDAAQRREHLLMTAALSAGNTAAILTAGPDVPRSSRLLGVLTTSGFVAAALYGLSQQN